MLSTKSTFVATAFLATLAQPGQNAWVTDAVAGTKSQAAELEQIQSRRGRAGELERLRAAVRSAAPAMAVTQEGLTDAERDSLRQVQLDRIANFLAITGYNVGIINSLRSRGADIVAAAAALVNGHPTVEQKALLSDAVIIGEIVRVDRSAAAEDNFGSTVQISVRESLKGAAKASTTVLLRQVSGKNADGTFTVNSVDEVLQEGQTHLIFLSREAYENNVLRRGGRPRGTVFGASNEATAFQIFLPYLIDGNVLRATAPGQTDEQNAAGVFERVRALPIDPTQRR